MTGIRSVSLPGLLAAIWVSYVACAATWTSSADQSHGQPAFSKGGPAGVTRDLAFLGRDREKSELPTGANAVALDQTVFEGFGSNYSTAWPPDSLDWTESPVDLSFLNKPEIPAGKRGFLRAAGDKLVFEDGTVARFWGTNISGSAIFQTSHENVRLQARRLSELGFNLVRLHHHDSAWVNPNIFGPAGSGDTQAISAAMLEKIDWWIKCLKDEGIYIWLDLHVGRVLKRGDRIEAFDDMGRGGSVADLKGFSYVNASVRNAMKKFNESYINRLNSYTHTQYKNEPAIVGMLVTNENDLTGHYGNALLPNKGVPVHSSWYMAAANAFAVSKGLPQDKIWRSWEHGPSKLFLNDLERSFNEEMVGHLRAQGVRVPVATTSSWGSNPLSSLPALTSGSIIDAHAYGGTGELEMNPAYSPNIVNWLAAAQVSGRPFSVSEWNVEQFPVPDRNAIPIYIASSASFQGWDALMQYAYAQDPLNNAGVASNWHAFNDPALMATLPAGALLYRRGDVREARTVFAFVPSADQLFNQEISPQTSVALRTASERGRLVIVMPMTEHLPWLEKSELPPGAIKIVDPNQSLIGEGASAVISDTGELRRNWADGTYIVDTPRTQAAMGRIGGQKLGLTDVHIETMTRNATIAVQSLDENPIAMSRAIMISIAAKSVPNANNDLPFRSESVEGQVSIRAPRRLNLYAQELIHTPVSSHKSVGSRSGRLSKRLQATYKDGRYFINLMQASGRHFMVLK